MKTEYLEWDSNFFQKKIGRIDCLPDEDTSNLSILLEQAGQEGYDLIYCFGNESFYVERVLLNDFQGALVDRKVVFSGSTQIGRGSLLSVREYTDMEPDPALIHLACLSGTYSRYKLDPHFTDADFRNFYQTWIRNSLSKCIADKTFVVYENDRIIGFVTVKKYSEYGQIGLIATDESVQGKGYGKLLIDAVKKYFYDEGLSVLEVATQVDNLGACHFYKRCGLSVDRINNIYHFWLK